MEDGVGVIVRWRRDVGCSSLSRLENAAGPWCRLEGVAGDGAGILLALDTRWRTNGADPSEKLEKAGEGARADPPPIDDRPPPYDCDSRLLLLPTVPRDSRPTPSDAPSRMTSRSSARFVEMFHRGLLPLPSALGAGEADLIDRV